MMISAEFVGVRPPIWTGRMLSTSSSLSGA